MHERMQKFANSISANAQATIDELSEKLREYESREDPSIALLEENRQLQERMKDAQEINNRVVGELEKKIGELESKISELQTNMPKAWMPGMEEETKKGKGEKKTDNPKK